MKPRALIPWFPGTNCHVEMARAFELAGANVEIVPFVDAKYARVRLAAADLIGFAGGFSFGDHFRSGAVAACDLANRFRDELLEARAKKIPMLGICNGFQILVETGLLPGNCEFGQPSAMLDINLSTRFEHWTNRPLFFPADPRIACVWTNELADQCFTLPVAHGEGRLVPERAEAYLITAVYGLNDEGDLTASPNGNVIAAICSPDKTVMGMMPHPERRTDPLRGGNQGLAIFRAGVAAVR